MKRYARAAEESVSPNDTRFVDRIGGVFTKKSEPFSAAVAPTPTAACAGRTVDLRLSSFLYW